MRQITHMHVLGALLWCAFGCHADAPKEAPKPPLLTRGAALPRIDVHLHIHPESAALALSILEQQHIVIGLNASGGEPGQGLETSLELAKSSRGRLQPLCNLSFSLIAHAEWERYATSTLDECKALGGRGLKVSKFVGLGLTDATGKLVPVDDPRLDPVFEHAGKLGLPVLIHSGDPRAFFEPPTADNERYAELRVHPGWSFHGLSPSGQPWPSWEAILGQFERRVARHPHTTFVGAHFGNAAEDPDRVARWLRRYPNLYIDTAARIPEFGRHPAARMRAFFIEFQDRVLFGSDLGVGPGAVTLGSGGERPGTREEAPVFFERHWAYFETNEAHMPHPTPIQGNWTVDGIGLPRAVLEKLYHANAARLFGLQDDLKRLGG